MENRPTETQYPYLDTDGRMVMDGVALTPAICPLGFQYCETCQYAKSDYGDWLCDYPYIGSKKVLLCH